MVIASMKNRYKSWLNGLPIDYVPTRWTRVKEFVRCINTTNKKTVLKGWQKTLNEGLDVDEELFGNADNQEELLLHAEMEALMIENGGDDGTDDSQDVEHEDDIELVPIHPQIEQPKKNKQSRITDFFH